MKLHYSSEKGLLVNARDRPVRTALLAAAICVWGLSVSLLALPNQASLIDRDVWTSGGMVCRLAMMNDGLYISRRMTGQLAFSMVKVGLLPVVGVTSALLAVSVFVWLLGRRQA